MAAPKLEPGLVLTPCLRFDDLLARKFTDTVADECLIDLAGPDGQAKRFPGLREDLEALAFGHAFVEIYGCRTLPRIIQVTETSFRHEPGEAYAGLPPEGFEAPRPSETAVTHAMASFTAEGGRFEATGCFHRAGAFDPATGELVVMTEDIARHNSVDRLATALVRQNRRPCDLGLLLSARTTYSITDKALRLGFRLLVSRAAPTTLGIQTAKEAGATLINFCRPGRFTRFAP